MKIYTALFTTTIFLIISSSVYPRDNSLTAEGSIFERVDLHKSIIKQANFVPRADWPNTIQSGGTGLAEASVLNGGNTGSLQLTLQSINGFGADQLITYEGNDGQYFTAVIAGINGLVVTLKSPLEASLSNPQRIRNFYADPDHPNEHGYKAIADYVLRNLLELDTGKHVLLGDSWFDHYPRHFSNRLEKKLPKATIINAGKGGNTTQNLLDRFDSAVAMLKPDTVWLMASTNDYNQYVSKEEYSKNIKTLIQKINALGARAIVFNSSVGKPLTHSPEGKQYPSPLDTMEMLSRGYYNELERMFDR